MWAGRRGQVYSYRTTPAKLTRRVLLELTEPDKREAWLLTIATHYGIKTRPRAAAKKLIMALQYVHPGTECTKQIVSWRARHRAKPGGNLYAPQLSAYITQFYKAREWLLMRDPTAMRYAVRCNEQKPKDERRADDRLGPSAFSALLADREFDAISDVAARLAARSFKTVDVIHDGLHILRPPTGTYEEGRAQLAAALAEVSAEVRKTRRWRFFKVRIKPFEVPESAPLLDESHITDALQKAHAWIGPKVTALAAKRRGDRIDWVAGTAQQGAKAQQKGKRSSARAGLPTGRKVGGPSARPKGTRKTGGSRDEGMHSDKGGSRVTAHGTSNTEAGRGMVSKAPSRASSVMCIPNLPSYTVIVPVRAA
jgi:hypothetical protein